MGDQEPTAVATSRRHPPQWARNLGMRPLSINPNQCPFRETSRITIRSDHRSVLSPRIRVHLCKSVACSSDAWKSATDSHRFTQIVLLPASAVHTHDSLGVRWERSGKESTRRGLLAKQWSVPSQGWAGSSSSGAIVRGGDNSSSSDPVTLSGGCLGCATTND